MNRHNLAPFSWCSRIVSHARWTSLVISFLFAQAGYSQLPPQSPCSGGQFYQGGIAYEVETHAPLTEAALTNDKCEIHAFLKNELLIQSGLLDLALSGGETHTLLNWAKLGSIREDDDGRFWNHFHDPILDFRVDHPARSRG